MFRARLSLGARNGVLKCQNAEIDTPNFIVNTTRGAVPHLTGDNSPQIPVAGVYIEELYDREGPILNLAKRDKLPLRAQVLLCCARKPESRNISNKPNTDELMAIDTLQGSRLAKLSDIRTFINKFEPDLCVVPYDIPAQSVGGKVGGNRLRKMENRSMKWLKEFHQDRSTQSGEWLLVASIHPQLLKQDYLGEAEPLVEGINVPFNNETLFIVNDGQQAPIDKTTTEKYESKLRMSNLPNKSWPEVLNDIFNGSDLVNVPLTQYADAGHALTLSLDANSPEYIDLNDSKYVTDMSKLEYTDYSLAYVHHLLNAEEMTAQVLLQTHNFNVVNKLFEDIRKAVNDGTFAEKRQQFLHVYT